MIPMQVATMNKCQDQLSTSHPTTEIQTSSLTAIQRLRAITIIGPILRSWNSHPWDADLSNQSDGCVRNRKSYLKYMRGLITEVLETQTTPIALIMPHWPINNPKSTRGSRDFILASKLSGGDQDARGEMLYALPTWQDKSQYATWIGRAHILIYENCSKFREP